MNPDHRLDACAHDLRSAGRAFQTAAGEPDSARLAPAALGELERAAETLGASWHQLAAAVPPSREQVVHVIALHDVAVAFDRCARACTDARLTVASLGDATVQAGRDG